MPSTRGLALRAILYPLVFASWYNLVGNLVVEVKYMHMPVQLAGILFAVLGAAVWFLFGYLVAREKYRKEIQKLYKAFMSDNGEQ